MKKFFYLSLLALAAYVTLTYTHFWPFTALNGNKFEITKLEVTKAEAAKSDDSKLDEKGAVPTGPLPAIKEGDPLPANRFVELAKLVNPSVVNISTKTMPKFRNRMYGDPLFEMLERMYGFGYGGPQPQNIQPQRALGTGFIVRDDGLIITNNHVVEGADVINVQLTEGSEKLYEATLIGKDQRTDIALIKISPGIKLNAAQLGASKDLQVGEWVAAFGNPYGHGHTMTKGIISAKGRAIDELNQFPFLQTDASINPGNSGGPLVNTQGYVIGVNTAIDARAQGIGFAIPIDDVKSILPQLEKNGKIKRGYIGIMMTELNPEVLESLGFSQKDKIPDGVLVTQTEEGGPAQKAGVQPYDIIFEFNGKKIKSSQDLSNAVTSVPVGQGAKMKLMREGKEKTLDVTIAERPEDFKMAQNEDVKKGFGQKAPFELGFIVANVSVGMSQEWGIPRQFVGRPVVLDTIEGSPASRSGLQTGDLILDINRKSVSNTVEVMRNLKKGNNTLRVGRGNRVILIMIQG